MDNLKLVGCVGFAGTVFFSLTYPDNDNEHIRTYGLLNLSFPVVETAHSWFQRKY
ncbi:hypothetical protein Gotur_018506 [Gossypium turneri]